MSLGEKLKCLRLNGRRTLKEQSKALGVSLNSVYRWEHDIAEPRRPMMRKIVSLSKVPLDWLFTDSEQQDEYFAPYGGVIYLDQNTERDLLRIFRRLKGNEQNKVLGYVERIYVESIDKVQELPMEAVASGE